MWCNICNKYSCYCAYKKNIPINKFGCEIGIKPPIYIFLEM